jgi:hypothetical protein
VGDHRVLAAFLDRRHRQHQDQYNQAYGCFDNNGSI